MAFSGVIQRYRDFLPVSNRTPVVTLGEGSTPLIPAPRLAREIGGKLRIFLKYEGMNPTGSFKDRGMTLALSKAVEEGSTAVVCASYAAMQAATAMTFTEALAICSLLGGSPPITHTTA